MKSKILWTEKTWNVFTGCTHCSPGCDHCYAERMAKRLQKNPKTAEKYRNGFKFTYHPMEMINFYHNLKTVKKPKKIFVNSMSDTFHEDAPPTAIETLFEIMNELQQHTFQLLTKRPQNIPSGLKWTKNIHLGVTVCTQEEADKKIPLLVNVGAWKIFLSIEPMIELIDLSKYWICSNGGEYPFRYLKEKFRTKMVDMVDLVIVGGESGPKARPMHPDRVRSVRDQCADAGVPFMFKQWGDGILNYKENSGEYSYLLDGIALHKSGWNPEEKKGGRILEGKIHDGKIVS